MNDYEKRKKILDEILKDSEKISVPEKFNPILIIGTGDEKDGTEEQTNSNEN